MIQINIQQHQFRINFEWFQLIRQDIWRQIFEPFYHRWARPFSPFRPFTVVRLQTDNFRLFLQQTAKRQIYICTMPSLPFLFDFSLNFTIPNIFSLRNFQLTQHYGAAFEVLNFSPRSYWICIWILKTLSSSTHWLIVLSMGRENTHCKIRFT